VTKDYVQAGVWTRKAAEQGIGWSQFILGLYFYNGHGLERDVVKAAI
jgi:TPR repeat protein